MGIPLGMWSSSTRLPALGVGSNAEATRRGLFGRHAKGACCGSTGNACFYLVGGLEHGHGKSLINGGFNGKIIYSYIIICLVVWNHGIL